MSVAAMMGGSTGLQMVGTMMSAKASHSLNKANSRIFKANALAVEGNRENQKKIDQKAFRRFVGDNLVAAGGSGNVAELSDADFDDIADYERESLLLDFAAEVDALNNRNQGRISNFKAKVALEAGFVKAATQAAGGASQIAQL